MVLDTWKLKINKESLQQKYTVYYGDLTDSYRILQIIYGLFVTGYFIQWIKIHEASPKKRAYLRDNQSLNRYEGIKTISWILSEYRTIKITSKTTELKIISKTKKK